MQIRPSLRDRWFARRLHARYSAKPGSEHIASRVALAYLSACLRVYRPRTVIECGAGIGTITDALLSHWSGVERVVSIERNDFCLGELAKNLRRTDRLTLITQAANLSLLTNSADMIVADGQYGTEEAFRTARPGTIIFAEGNRRNLRADCQALLAARNLAVTFNELGVSYVHHRKLRRSRVRRVRGLVPIWKLITSTKRLSKGCWIGVVSEHAQNLVEDHHRLSVADRRAGAA
jgi:precorrin-6B methylase 2